MKYADLATFKQALNLAQRGYKKEAYTQLQTLTPLYPDDPRVLLGIVYTADSLAEAETALARATALAPYNQNIQAAHIWLANARGDNVQTLVPANYVTPAWTSLSAWLVDRDEIVEPYGTSGVSYTSQRTNRLPAITWAIVATLICALIGLAYLVAGSARQPATTTTSYTGLYAGNVKALDNVMRGWDSVSSYKANVSGNNVTTGAFGGTLTFVKPNRYKFALTEQGTDMRMVVIGTNAYLDRQRFWVQVDLNQMGSLPAVLTQMNLNSADMMQQFAGSTITLGTDTLNGKQVGTISLDTTGATALPGGVARGTKLTFAYDTGTFRTLQERVTTGRMDTTLHFFDFNSADNVVEVP